MVEYMTTRELEGLFERKEKKRFDPKDISQGLYGPSPRKYNSCGTCFSGCSCSGDDD